MNSLVAGEGLQKSNKFLQREAQTGPEKFGRTFAVGNCIIADRSLTKLEKRCESRLPLPRTRGHPWGLMGNGSHPRLELLEAALIRDKFGQRTLRSNVLSSVAMCEKYSGTGEVPPYRGHRTVID